MRILIVEDDAALRHAVSVKLSEDGFQITQCADGDEAAWYLRENAWDLILMDRMLPGVDGLALVRMARAAGLHAPVLMLTALDAIGDRVDGLDAGADDYLVKPFDMRELLARVRALARRPPHAEVENVVRVGNASLLPASCVLAGPNGSCTLSHKESDLLALLMANVGLTLTRATLFARVWGPDAPAVEASLDTYIHFVRRRLSAVGARLTVQNRRGVGYLLTEDTE